MKPTGHFYNFSLFSSLIELFVFCSATTKKKKGEKSTHLYLSSPSSSPVPTSHSLVQRNYSALCFHLRENETEKDRDRQEERFSKAHWLSWLSGHMEITKCVHCVCPLCMCVYVGHVAMCRGVFVSAPPQDIFFSERVRVGDERSK